MSVGHPAEYRRGFEQKWRAWYIYIFLIRGLAERLLPARDWFAIRKLIDDSAETDARIAALSRPGRLTAGRSEEHTSELQSLMRTSYAVFCLKKKTNKKYQNLCLIETNS